jgi:hypothetical protein
MTAIDQIGRTVAAGETYLLAGIVRRVEAANRVAIVTGSGEHRSVLRVDPAQLLRVDDLVVTDGSRPFTSAPQVDAVPEDDADAVNKLYLDTQLAALIGVAVDLFQPVDPLLTALAGLTTAADRLAYFTGSDTVALATLTAFGRALVAAANAAAARTELGLGGLATLAGSAAGDIAYWDGSAWQILPIGAEGDVLTVGAAGVPEWAAK